MDTPATGEGNNLATSAVIDPRTAIDPAALAALEHYKHPSKTNKGMCLLLAVLVCSCLRWHRRQASSSRVDTDAV